MRGALKNKTIIMGIDPSLANTGWGVVSLEANHLKFIACGSIASKENDISKKILYIYSELTNVINEFKPYEAGVEETFVNVNPASSLKLGQARGAIFLTLAQAGVNMYEYSPTKVKKALTGVGRAEKDQVMHMVKLLLPGSSVQNFDESDALAVAITHAHYSKILNR